MKPIALWSGPRNVSTALMYSFANRPDTRVMDEPLFGYFLKHTGVARPSREEVLKTMNLNAAEVLREMTTSMPGQLLFSKNMASHLEGLTLEILLHFENLILIREPAAVIGSYRKNIDAPGMLDLGYRHQLRIVEFLRSAGRPVHIIDSDELRAAPEKHLRKLCADISISFHENMLQWPAGPRPEDGVWAQYWYHAVHRSTGFEPPKPGQKKVPEPLRELHRECQDLYLKIKEIQNEQVQSTGSPE